MACRTTIGIDLRKLDRHRDAAVSSLIPTLSCRSCRPHAPFTELVRLSRTSRGEMHEEPRRRVLRIAPSPLTPGCPRSSPLARRWLSAFRFPAIVDEQALAFSLALVAQAPVGEALTHDNARTGLAAFHPFDCPVGRASLAAIRARAGKRRPGADDLRILQIVAPDVAVCSKILRSVWLLLSA